MWCLKGEGFVAGVWHASCGVVVATVLPLLKPVAEVAALCCDWCRAVSCCALRLLPSCEASSLCRHVLPFVRTRPAATRVCVGLWGRARARASSCASSLTARCPRLPPTQAGCSGAGSCGYHGQCINDSCVCDEGWVPTADNSTCDFPGLPRTCGPRGGTACVRNRASCMYRALCIVYRCLVCIVNHVHRVGPLRQCADGMTRCVLWL